MEEDGNTATVDIVKNLLYGITKSAREYKDWERRAFENSEEHVEFVDNALTWIRSYEIETSSDYMYNLKTICGNEAIANAEMSYACSLIATYAKHLDIVNKKKQEKVSDANSQYVGEKGVRKDFAVHVDKVIGFDTEFGYAHLTKMFDENGNVLVWMSGNCLEEGKDYIIKGTIKDHNEYNGVKQTHLSRCKVIKEVQDNE